MNTTSPLYINEFTSAICKTTFVQRLEFEWNNVRNRRDVGIYLCDDLGNPKALLKLEFSDVRDFTAPGSGTGMEQLMALRLEDLRDRSLDRVCFRVVEAEYSALGFSCAHAKIVDLNSNTVLLDL